jgi:hypothetical protein
MALEFRSVCAKVGVLKTGADTKTKQEPPDAYGKATRQAPCPHDTPGYRPHGQPPDAYAAGVERLRREKR